MVKFGAGAVAMVLLSAGPVSAYRPFVSTDAAVADWEFTAGVTFGFKLAPFPRPGPGS